jgi:uncharacterized membrane protein YheB (UPF0754 family)
LIFTLLSKIVSGAVVGYITNDLAIQMLFRKRFGLGGIVIRTKDEFITNVSKLVEREIINHHTIEKEINLSPTLLAQAIEQISTDFFDNQLYLIIPEGTTIAQIQGINESYQQLIQPPPSPLKEGEMSNLSPFGGGKGEESPSLPLSVSPQTTLIISPQATLDFLFTHTPVKSLLSSTQLDFAVHSLTNAMKDIVLPSQKGRVGRPSLRWGEVLESAYIDLKDKELAQVLPTNFSNKVIKNIADSFGNFHEDLRDNFALPIDENIKQVSNLLEINTLIRNISEQIAQRKLHDIFGKDSTENISVEVNQRLLQIVNSDEGKQMITSFADFLVKVLENEKTTIFELLSDDLAQNFDNFLHAKLPIVLKSLITWLEERKDKLELLIDSTFKNNVKSRFQDLILRFFVGSVSQYANIVKKMTEIIDQHRQNPEETADRLTEQLINFLKGNTIGDIITQLKSNPTFNQKVDIGSLLMENINLALIPHPLPPPLLGGEHSPPRRGGLGGATIFNLTSFFNRNLGDFVSAVEIENFLNKIINQLIDKQLKNEFLYHERFSKLLSERLENELSKLLTKKISQILPLETFDKLSDFLAKNLHDLLQSKQNQIVEFFKEIIDKQLQNKTFADYITPKQTEKWNPFIIQATENLLDTQFEKLKEKEVRELIEQFNQTDLKIQVPVFLQNTLVQNLPQLLTGKVEMAVSSSMHKMNADKLRDLVEKFMGKELKPITIFGAFLGALAGAGLYALPSDNLLDLMNLGIASLAYGITGYGTNWLALKMIFRPYYQQFFPFTKIPVPFTPGVAAKNQGRFAQNMGKFVVNGLLNKAHLADTFFRNKENLRKQIIKFFVGNDFEFLKKQVEKNKESWSEKGSNALFDTLIQKQDFVNEQISKIIDENKDKSLQDFPQTEKLTQLLEKQIIEYTESERFQRQAHHFLKDSLQKVSGNTKTLDSLLSPKIKDNAYPQISELIEKQFIKLFSNLEKTLTEDIFKKEIIPFDYYNEKTLNYYINPTQKENLKEKISATLRNKLIDNEIKQAIFKFIDSRLSEELNPQKKISELFGGNLTKIIQENIDNVVDNLIKFGLDWLDKNKDDLANLVYEKAYQESKAAALYKDPIKNTVKELAEEGIPFFFKKESASLKGLVADGVHQIGESPMSQLKINVDNEYLKAKVDEFLKREEILDAIQRLLDLLIEEIFKLPISVFLKILSIEEVGDLKRILHQEISLLSSHLSENGLAKNKEISAIAGILLLNIAEKHTSQTTIQSIFEGVGETDFAEVAENWTRLVMEGAEIQQFKNTLIADFLQQIKDKQFGEILSSEVLKNDIRLFMKDLLAKEETKIHFTVQLKNLIESSLTNLVDKIAPETKMFLINQLTEAALNALENNLDALLGGIDLKKIVESEVSTMQPKEIESLFYSFADKYFTQLINYGFGFGIIFGLLVDFILMVLLQLLNK